jgi:hypothetical protein
VWITVGAERHEFCMSPAIAIEPIGASTCIRAARLVECPIGVYSACSSPVWIDRHAGTHQIGQLHWQVKTGGWNRFVTSSL